MTANSSATVAAADLTTVTQLRQEIEDINEQARNNTQVELLTSELLAAAFVVCICMIV